MARGGDIDRLLAVAISDEQSGVAFYKTLASQASSQDVRGLFESMSEQEKAHAARFLELAKKLEEENPPVQYEDEYTGYIQALIAEGGADSLRRDIESCTTDVERISLAISYEKEQLALQNDLAQFISSDYKQIVNVVIEEERGHIVRLSQKKGSA